MKSKLFRVTTRRLYRKIPIFQFLENINIYNNSKSAIFNIKEYYVLVLLYFPKSW